MLMSPNIAKKKPRAIKKRFKNLDKHKNNDRIKIILQTNNKITKKNKKNKQQKTLKAKDYYKR